MTDERMLRLIRSAASWLVALSIFDVYNDYYLFNVSSSRKENYFDDIFLRNGKSYKSESKRWRISSIMKLVKFANIFECLDSIIYSNNKTESFKLTKENARIAKEQFLKRFGEKIPPIN